jgi:hypothetical protein
VDLCFSGFDFFGFTSCDAFGAPTRSRAISRTTLAAEKTFFFGLRGMIVFFVSVSHLRTFNTQKCNNLSLAARSHSFAKKNE